MGRIAGALLATFLLAACGTGTGASQAGEVQVAAGFYPLYEVAGRVGGDRAEVTNLTPPGGEPHDLELTTREVDELLDADVVVYLGQGFQPGVEEVAEDRDGITVDVLEGQELHEGEEDAHAEEEEEEEGHEEEEGALDPHVWLDPNRMLQIVDRVEEALIEADPDGRAIYRRNAGGYREVLEGLAEEFETGLADCEQDLIVTSHSAFGYLAEAYGLRQESIAGISPEVEPDPKRLDELVHEVQEEGVTTIFTETLVSPEVAETLAREAGVRTDVLNPLEGLTAEQEEAGEDYVSVMRDNLERLREALDCA